LRFNHSGEPVGRMSKSGFLVFQLPELTVSLFRANIRDENLWNGVWLILGVFLLYMLYRVYVLRKTFRI
jgi:hypothetical protein